MAADTDKNMNELRDEVARLRSDISQITDTLQKLSGDFVADGRDRLSGAAKHQADKVRESWGSVENEIEHRPLTSVAAAFGIGFVIGKLLDR